MVVDIFGFGDAPRIGYTREDDADVLMIEDNIYRGRN